ncbi:MAG: type II toxin-antitoxin system VapC family toxin [Limnospira sp. PMC 1291.21]|uniref:type II toxin-antitoxin system VapC family toxin n=1 Tax=unclassified Limnospira TaxID=2642885 RepID=UPI0028E13302|nr:MULTISPECIES: type II toxin-antitoxin system VapC family toxin [unclassified Limnospira]MDT9177769.1 type II toxin-antitoxin system VapC family toxin [Limnospira sp. PMC 1238.20]MDT9193026.1 type II toxin-antitoxin system VapC family toxin [Limnospira sp. PMC 1245.20]MDT9202206.1 type II toxin-antitoxin system VapC family toxin [Limnospira sp. PMC 1243.20]MDT9209758.1 type II toxin-antitoxin system VapC family toxin [Limnospira sp. PMC 1252.20]MDT9213731.1 type II toxin-antitoxin system Vap
MSKVIVLDTHIWIWLITQEFERFPAHWCDQIYAADEVGISPVSCYEVAVAYKKGRLELPCPVNEWLHEALTPTGISLMPLNAEVACQAVNLSAIHQDPFDRIIIATALVYQGQLASVDRQFTRYPELTDYLMR